MRLATKIILTIILAVIAIGLLVGRFGDLLSSPFATAEKGTTDPYNITKVRPQSKYTVNIIKTKMKFNSQTISRYVYSNSHNVIYPAGQPIVLAAGKQVTVNVKNASGTATNVHWHGLTIPNNMDGALDKIDNGSSKTFVFTPTETGTYWYHSHYRPVETQVGKGMFGPLVVKSAVDDKYNLDELLILSDLPNGYSGMTGSHADANLVNGQLVPPTLQLKGGQLGQLRFINASADNSKIVKLPFSAKVTHKDGYALAKPYSTHTLKLYPWQRIDVEVALTGTENRRYQILDGSVKISLDYIGNHIKKGKSLFTPAKASPIDQALLEKTPDFTLALAGNMNGWTINGQVYPNLPTMQVKVGQTYKVRFTSPDGMMSYDHPMHIHGAHFQVIAVDGRATNDETWYDIYPMKAGKTTDIAVKFDFPGVWVVHCHILGHEDAGMMTSFTAN